MNSTMKLNKKKKKVTLEILKNFENLKQFVRGELDKLWDQLKVVGGG